MCRRFNQWPISCVAVRPRSNGDAAVPPVPNAAGPNYGKPVFPHVSCTNGPNGDMFMNYMDYVDDAGMLLFTPQQVERMHAALQGPRRSLLRAR